MKNTLLLAIVGAGLLPAMGSTQQDFNIDINAGTQGAGMSVGYHVTPSVRLDCAVPFSAIPPAKAGVIRMPG